ncbi:hypothetical protein EV193_11474 [Herbihabitans rhizosphaerae]|uniref:Uncharacterized protein n=1 Tax=Herbihabitans rhizosphaerae TaxID=1872711 RepID=A0A4V2ERI0_9PSEU|nr:hypothetical protein [Herbihabitans rhizosphaerae]RZS31383.1 hypothetical protein EV193_11474 [Herbihabitans rhizosphaerae]
MRKISAALFALVAVVVAVFGLTGTASAEAPLTVDRTVVRAGEELRVSGDAGPETFNWVGSPAFARQADDPYPGDGGSAAVTVDQNGHYQGVARIANVQPGEYTVTARIGGGNAGSVTITVVR